MLRNCDLSEITDGKFYGINDMVRVGCNECEGCSSCCKNMGETIILDPLDIYNLTTNLGASFEHLLVKYIELHVVDGLILPNLKMDPEHNQCVFLNKEGRCSIHSFRPGICRIFPLGRVYENNSFQYILQVNECKKENRSKVKVMKWIDTPDVKKNQQFINDWHYYIKELQDKIQKSEDQSQIKEWNMELLQRFYQTPYDAKRDFYEQFYERMQS